MKEYNKLVKILIINQPNPNPNNKPDRLGQYNVLIFFKWKVKHKQKKTPIKTLTLTLTKTQKFIIWFI